MPEKDTRLSAQIALSDGLERSPPGEGPRSRPTEEM